MDDSELIEFMAEREEAIKIARSWAQHTYRKPKELDEAYQKIRDQFCGDCEPSLITMPDRESYLDNRSMWRDAGGYEGAVLNEKSGFIFAHERETLRFRFFGLSGMYYPFHESGIHIEVLDTDGYNSVRDWPEFSQYAGEVLQRTRDRTLRIYEQQAEWVDPETLGEKPEAGHVQNSIEGFVATTFWAYDETRGDDHPYPNELIRHVRHIQPLDLSTLGQHERGDFPTSSTYHHDD